MFRILLYTGAVAAAASALGQTAAPRPDPLDASAEVPPAACASPLADYRRAAEVPLGAWRELNDRVARVGGWRSYAREAAAPASSASGPQRP